MGIGSQLGQTRINLILNSGQTLKQCAKYKYIDMQLTRNGNPTEVKKMSNITT